MVVPRLTKLKHPGLPYQQLTVPVELAIFFGEPLGPLLPVFRVKARYSDSKASDLA